MKILDVVQGSIEWRLCRAGIVTASAMDQIITPKERIPAKKPQAKYRNRLIAEWLLGEPIADATSPFMARGSELEAQAMSWYAFERDVEVQQVGLVTTDDGLIGGSPDGLIGDDGGLEVKCYEIVHHVGAALTDLSSEHVCQVQGCMMVCERQWWDVLFFNPVFPPVIRRVMRDDEFIDDLRAECEMFNERLASAKQRLLDDGWQPIRRVECPHGVDRRICRACREVLDTEV